MRNMIHSPFMPWQRLPDCQLCSNMQLSFLRIYYLHHAFTSMTFGNLQVCAARRWHICSEGTGPGRPAQCDPGRLLAEQGPCTGKGGPPGGKLLACARKGTTFGHDCNVLRWTIEDLHVQIAVVLLAPPCVSSQHPVLQGKQLQQLTPSQIF